MKHFRTEEQAHNFFMEAAYRAQMKNRRRREKQQKPEIKKAN